MQDQWKCLAISLGGVFVALVAAIRRFGVAASVLVVNVMPVATVLGLAGWLGVEVDLGVAMIAAISLGISVDGSLHLWFDLRRLLDEGREMSDAVVEAETNVGPAVLFSTLALAAGFSSLAVSNFAPTVHFGVLTAAAMLGSLVGNLIVLPSLLLSFSSSSSQNRANLSA